MTAISTRGRLISAALVVIVVALAVAVVWLWTNRDRLASERTAQNDALRAARQAATDLTTYSFDSLNADYAKAESDGTPGFRQKIAVVEKSSRDVVTATKATFKGTVVEAVAQAKDPDHVTALLFVDQTGTTPQAQQQALDDSLRIKMALVRQGGRWLVDDVDVTHASQ